MRTLIKVTKARALIPIVTTTYLSQEQNSVVMAFLSQDPYFQRQELECMLEFLLLSTRPVPPTASPLQLLPRQLIEKCCVAWRILINPSVDTCTHTQTHTSNSFVCLCQCAHFCICFLVVSETSPKHSWQCHRVFQPHFILYLIL